MVCISPEKFGKHVFRGTSGMTRPKENSASMRELSTVSLTEAGEARGIRMTTPRGPVESTGCRSLLVERYEYEWPKKRQSMDGGTRTLKILPR